MQVALQIAHATKTQENTLNYHCIKFGKHFESC